MVQNLWRVQFQGGDCPPPELNPGSAPVHVYTQKLYNTYILFPPPYKTNGQCEEGVGASLPAKAS